MAFIVVQNKCQVEVLKPWYGCSFPESSTLSDLYMCYATGQLDETDALDE